MVGSGGLEPPMPEGGRFTVSCNSRYANYPFTKIKTIKEQKLVAGCNPTVNNYIRNGREVNFFVFNCSQTGSATVNIIMKSRSERWSVGAGKYNKEQLKQRQEDYIVNPDRCSFCEEVMSYAPLKERIKRKFCNKSCAAKHNNEIRLQSKTVYQKGLTKETNCVVCETIIKIGKNANTHQAKCLGCKTEKIKICKSCDKQYKTLTNRSCCSVECSKYQKQKGGSLGGKISASKIIKRSRGEIKLYELCKNYFNSVRHNEIIKDGWDADIIIDDYSIAILWNGPWHYKQMTLKNHSLLQVQNRDKIKLEVLSSEGWNVIVFNDNLYTPEEAFEILKSGYRGRI